MLIAMVSVIVSRFIAARTVEEHAMSLSGHQHAGLCEQLVRAWVSLRGDDHDAKNKPIRAQRNIYTGIKNASDHKAWRASCAQHFAAHLLSALDNLLSSHLSPAGLAERSHVLQELVVKGYRIGFRLHMGTAKWQFQWPVPGAVFDGASMVNESRMLYGDVLSTMREMLSSPGEHAVRFAVSPTVVKSDCSVRYEKREVVHSSLVHVT